MIYTDDYKVYSPLTDKGYGHSRINHSEKVYVMGNSYATNPGTEPRVGRSPRAGAAAAAVFSRSERSAMLPAGYCNAPRNIPVYL